MNTDTNYVGITATQMIEKLDIHYAIADGELFVVEEENDIRKPASTYERRLFAQAVEEHETKLWD
jgi:hypothetical protein